MQNKIYELKFKVPKGDPKNKNYFTIKQLKKLNQHTKIIEHIKSYYIVTYNNLEDPLADQETLDIVFNVSKNNELKNDLVFHYYFYESYFGMTYKNTETNNFDTLTLSYDIMYQTNGGWPFPGYVLLTPVNIQTSEINFDNFKNTLFRLQDPLLVDKFKKMPLKSSKNVIENLHEFYGLDTIKQLKAKGINTVWDMFIRYLQPEDLSNLFIKLENSPVDLLNINYVLINDKYLFECSLTTEYFRDNSYNLNIDFLIENPTLSLSNMVEVNFIRESKILTQSNNIKSLSNTTTETKKILDANANGKYVLNLKLKPVPQGMYTESYPETFIVNQDTIERSYYEYLNNNSGIPFSLYDAYVTKHAI